MTTANARAMIGRSSRGASQIAQPMNERLSSTGVKAGIANRRYVLSTPATSATSDMKRMYGNIQRVITVASWNASGLRASPEAINQTSTGAASTPATETASSTQNNADPTWLTNSEVVSSLPRERTSASIGTKACWNAPSANSLRSRFGSRNATLNASVSALAPNRREISMSRARPVTRESSVRLLTVARARNRFTQWECGDPGELLFADAHSGVDAAAGRGCLVVRA